MLVRQHPALTTTQNLEGSNIMAKKDDSKGKKGGVKDTLTNVAKNVVVELFGKSQSGFVADSKLLQTQKDGRLFALELMKKIENASKSSPHYTGIFSALETEEVDGKPYTFPPQSQMVREAFDWIYAATEGARAGFFVVMTDRLAQLYGGRTNLSAMERWEAEGRMREMPEPSPEQVWEALQAEKAPHIPEGQPDAVEDFISDNGPWRRAAMAYLSRPWSEIAEQIQNDRPTAVAFAGLSQALHGTAANYRLVAEWIEAAEHRLMVALCAREDMKSVLADARAGQAGAQERKQLPEAKFLGTQRDGRKLAIDLLKMIQKWGEAAAGPDGVYSPFAVLEHDPDDKEFLWRKGPQSTQIRRAFDVIYKSDEPVRKGFFAVLSDWIAQSLGDVVPDPEYYEEFELRGVIKDVEGDDNG